MISVSYLQHMQLLLRLLLPEPFWNFGHFALQIHKTFKLVKIPIKNDNVNSTQNKLEFSTRVGTIAHR